MPTHDGLIRIQNEISEVEKRETELRKEHASSRSNSINGDVSEASSSPEPIVSPVNVDSKDHFKKNKIIEPQPKPQYLPAPGLTRALSTPQLFQVSPMKKFNINAPHKGMMEKFIASRGKMIGNQPAQSNFKKNLMMVRKMLICGRIEIHFIILVRSHRLNSTAEASRHLPPWKSPPPSSVM